ncbi:MAG: hypothetical protein JO051_10485 [Acidobacteriaceae bacterium]|nr:hypothetical protein [Acidobacteriaceae bacterium]
MNPPADPAAYIAAVLALYTDLPDTAMHVSTTAHVLARRFFEQQIFQTLVETALLLASLRRLARPAEAPPLSPIRSLAYFKPVIEELRTHPAHESYLEYLRLKMRRALELSANCPKIYVFR